MTPHRFTAKQKAKALAAYPEHGPSYAARLIGCSRSAVVHWAHDKADSRIETNVASPAGIEDANAVMKRKRIQLRGDLLSKALALVNAVSIDDIDISSARDVQAVATAVAIFIDKFRLENGEVTGRTEHLTIDQVEAELQRILAESA
jgi:hypothetical protein